MRTSCEEIIAIVSISFWNVSLHLMNPTYFLSQSNIPGMKLLGNLHRQLQKRFKLSQKSNLFNLYNYFWLLSQETILNFKCELLNILFKVCHLGNQGGDPETQPHKTENLFKFFQSIFLLWFTVMKYVGNKILPVWNVLVFPVDIKELKWLWHQSACRMQIKMDAHMGSRKMAPCPSHSTNLSSHAYDLEISFSHNLSRVTKVQICFIF